jgi:hypothetical protein
MQCDPDTLQEMLDDPHVRVYAKLPDRTKILLDPADGWTAEMAFANFPPGQEWWTAPAEGYVVPDEVPAPAEDAVPAEEPALLGDEPPADEPPAGEETVPAEE